MGMMPPAAAGHGGGRSENRVPSYLVDAAHTNEVIGVLPKAVPSVLGRSERNESEALRTDR